MRYNRTAKVFTIIGLSIFLVCMTVAYAVLSANLSISGSGTVKNAGWDIHFEKPAISAQSAGSTATVPTIEGGTTLKDFSATFTTGSDYVTYSFDVVNSGGIAGVIKTISLPTNVVCKGTTSDQACTDAEKNNLKWELKYDNGNTVQVNDTIPGATDPSQPTVQHMTLRIYFASTNANLASDDVKFSNLNFSIIYNQSTE